VEIMTVGSVEPFAIENEGEADAYLRDLLSHREFRSMDEVRIRAGKYIKDAHLKDYFINQATELVKTQSS
jgi:hypothetical protein